MKASLPVLLFMLLFSLDVYSQSSIHMEQLEYYNRIGFLADAEYDSISGFAVHPKRGDHKTRTLDKIVFGYHPYWAGSDYLNYQWDLLSDFSYFSYDVDPLSGEPASIYSWLSSPSIDSALANDVRVHLCVTLFSGHSTFFNNPQSRSTLTNNLISLVSDRGAQGVSLDFEAVPASQGNNMLDYIAEFATAYKDSLPDGILSIAMPAVDWSGIFDVSVLNQHIDLFMIMGYDYYWNGSTQAGPVDPHYSMTSTYDHNVSRTISYYQSEGMPLDKMLIGVPYYAREWPTASGVAPSSTTANGTAYTWARIKDNTSGNYSAENKKSEGNSLAPYYAYEENGWHQCFVNDTRSLERRYKMVNYRGLAGIGIWALGYDNGYPDLWEVIAENFTQEQITLYDTLYDSGGPSWYYYNDEDYVLTMHGMEDEGLLLTFAEFDLETGYDSLWVYDGEYPGGELLGGFTGSNLPPEIYTSELMSIRFRSDHNTRATGWMALVESTLINIDEAEESIICNIYPNPAAEILNVQLGAMSAFNTDLRIYDLRGQLMYEAIIPARTHHHIVDVNRLNPGVYIITTNFMNSKASRQKFIKF